MPFITQNRTENQIIPDLGKLVGSEADSNEARNRKSGGMQGDYDRSQIADGGKTRQTRRSINGTHKV